MAISLTRSRAIAQSLTQKVGFLGILGQSSWWCRSSSFQRNFSSTTTAPTAEKYYYKPFACNSTSALFLAGRFNSTVAVNQMDSLTSASDSDHDQAMDFPGGKVTYTSEMRFISESPEKRMPCYRVLDDNGDPISGSNFEEISNEVARKMYGDMVTLQIMDSILYEAQRQGRFSFYLTTTGEEAINIASAAALRADDVILPQCNSQS